MTARHSGYLVILDKDIREDDAGQSVLVALRMVKGVAKVTPVPAAPDGFIARERRDRQWRQALDDLYRNGPGEPES
jgi:hypothetical protein